MVWYDTFDSVFWLSISPMVLGACALCVRYAYRSKCTHVRLCWNCIDVERNVDDEIIADEKMPDDDPADSAPAVTKNR
jgi:hypothetical protein